MNHSFEFRSDAGLLHQTIAAIIGSMLLTLTVVEGGTLDTIVFGDTASETSHALNAPLSAVITGGIGQPARRMFPDPLDTNDHEGGYLDFTAKCDPISDNYVTLKLWGSDNNKTASGRMLLYQIVDGRQMEVGFRDPQVAEYSPLAWGDRAEMAIPGRFYYTTIPLPLSLTQGRTSVQLRVVGTGMAPVGSLPVYRAYVHTGSYFEPAAGDPQAPQPAPPPVRPSSGGDMAAQLVKAKAQTISNMTSWLANNNGDLAQLRSGYTVPWTPAYQNPLVPPRVVASLDTACQAYFANPGTADDDWGGAYGWVGEQMAQIGAAGFGTAFDAVVDLGDPAGPATRRVQWSKMLKASRDAGRTGRRGPTTNQGIICDKEIYNANKGLLIMGSADALTDEQAKRYLLEAVGLQPWLGNDNASGTPTAWMGTDYYLVTPAGLTKENGYVSAYGEVYDVSTAYYGMTGDERFKTRAIEMFRARSYFRYPMVDGDGYRSFQMVGPLDWRGHQSFPFDMAYGERGGRLSVALAVKDPHSIGYVHQMFEDGHGGVFGTDLGSALALEILINTPDSGERLPMTEGQPDYAWVDVENGIVAIKKGEELTWIEAYWQARGGIHSTGRVMQIAPTSARLAHVRISTQFEWNGNWRSTPNGASWEGVPVNHLNGTVNQAYWGEKILQAKAPASAAGSTREEFIGRAKFYSCRYGRYLVGINLDKVNSHVLKTPAGFASALDMITMTTKSGTVTVAPFSAVVLDMGGNTDAAPLPNSPRFVSATGVPGAVSVYWDTCGGATGYNLKRATSPGGPYTTIATGLGANYPVTWGNWPYGVYLDGATSIGTTYYYKVSGVNPSGESYDSPECPGASPTAAVASVNTLPAPWKNVNFAGGGSASHSAGTFTLTGGGGDFWNTADGGHFVYQTLVGDGTLIARLTNRNNAYKTGLMLRDTLAANSPEICITQQSGGLNGFRRNSVGGGTNYNGAGTGTPPVWFKLQRRGASITTSYAADNAGSPGTWTDMATSSAQIGITAYIGMATTSGTPTFDNVSLVDGVTTVPKVPVAPSGITAVPGNGNVMLGWLPASGASTYTVKRSLFDGGPYTTVVATGLTSLSFTNTGLTNGTPYFYVVSATNVVGPSVNSAQIAATPAAVPPPPADLTVATTGTQAALAWTASPGADSYTILRSVDGVTWATLASGLTATNQTDPTLVAGQSYYFAVVAVNANGSSPATVPIVTSAAPVPPVLRSVDSNSTQATIAWNAASGATGYHVWRAALAAGPFTKIAENITVSSYLDTGLTRDATHYYHITAVNAAGESTASNSIKLGWGTGLLARYYNSTNFSGVPVLSRIDPSIVFNWGQSSPAPAINADNFSVRWIGQLEAPSTGTYTFSAGGADDYFFMSINGVTFIKNQTVTTNLVAGQKYDVTIDFYDNAGAAYFSLNWANGSDPLQALPTSRLYPVALLASRATGGTASASTQNAPNESAAKAFDGINTTKWNNATGGTSGWLRYQFGGGAAWAISEYRLTSANDQPGRDPAAWQFQGSNDGTNWTTLDTRSVPADTDRYETKTYQVANTTAYSHYKLNITANAGGGAFNLQLAELGLYSPDLLLSPPPGIAATPGNGQVALDWADVPAATAYQIKRSVHNGGPFTLVTTVSPGSSFTDTGVVNGLTYYYVVAAVSTQGAGGNSNQAAATPGLVPIQEWELRAPPLQLSGGNVAITMGASVSGHTYQLQRNHSLDPETWQNIGSVKAGGGALEFTDTPNPVEPKAFYRILIGP